MSKSSTASNQKIQTPTAQTNAWAKGPPALATVTPRSQSPSNVTTPSSTTHSRRPSTLGQGIPVKDGVSVPRSNVGAAKHNSAVSFGSIDDATAAPLPAPVSASPATTSATIRAQVVKSFGTVPVQSSSNVNGNAPPPISTSSISSVTSPTTTTPTTKLPVTPSTANASTTGTTDAPKARMAMDVRKLFQNNPGAVPPSSSSSSSIPNSPSPSVRSATLPPQPSPTPSLQHGLSTPQSPAMPPNFNTYVPGLRPGQQPTPPNNGSAGRPPGSPSFQRQQIPNGMSGRQQTGPNGAQGGPPTGLAPSPVPMPQWQGGYYYTPDMYAQMYGQTGYYPHYPPPHQPMHGGQMPPGQFMQGGHPGQQQHPGAPPLTPRSGSVNLQGPGTPTQPHAQPSLHHHSSSTPNGPNLTSPPATPSTPAININANASNRLSFNANAFVPANKRLVIKNPSTNEELHFDKPATNRSAAPTPSSNNGSASTTPAPSAATPPPPVPTPQRNRVSVRLESESDKAARLAKETEAAAEVERKKKEAEDAIAKAAADKKAAEEKAEAEKLEAERKAAEEKAAAEKKALEEAEAKSRAEKERVEAEERAKKEAEDLAKREAEVAAAKEKAEAEAAEKSRLEKEAAEKEKAAQAAMPPPPVPTAPSALEDGEVLETVPEIPADSQSADVTTNTRAPLSIDTNSKRRPGNLDLNFNNQVIPPSLPSALATARIIEDLGSVPYPQGIQSPKAELNKDAVDGKFRYDRAFLMQFMAVCREKPDQLPNLSAIGIEAGDNAGNHAMSRSSSGRRPSGQLNAGNRQPSGLGISSFGRPGTQGGFGGMGNFQTSGAKMTSEDRFQASNRAVSAGTPAGFAGNRPAMSRTPSLAGTSVSGGASKEGRTRSKRGTPRPQADGPGQSRGNSFNNQQQGSSDFLGPVAPLEASANRWVATVGNSRNQPIAPDEDAPEVVDRKVKSLLNKLTMEKFDSISDQVIEWANKSQSQSDGRTLIQVIRLIFEKATDEAAWSEMYARLCRKMMEFISPDVHDDGIKNQDGKPIVGGQLFRKYLLNRCQEDFERGWAQKETTAAAAKATAANDTAAAQANEKGKEGGDGEVALYSDEYYAASKAKRQGLGLIKFIGELYKLSMLTERIMHLCVKKLLGNVDDPEEEEIESLCKLLATVGHLLDAGKSKLHMDVYMQRISELANGTSCTPRMKFMLMDLLDLRKSGWQSRNAVAAPTTIAQIHENAAREKAQAERESFQRQQQSMSRGGSKRGGDRGNQDQVGPDGWAVAGGPGGLARPPDRAGNISRFGQITKPVSGAPLTNMGPSSVFSKKGADRSKESTPVRANKYAMLSQGGESAAGPSDLSKLSRPPSRADTADSSTETPPTRKRLNLLPRTKTLEDVTPAPAAVTPDEPEEEEDEEQDSTEPSMSAEQVSKKIDGDIKEFFHIRKIGEAVDFFTDIPSMHRHTLVDKLVMFAIESKASDAQLVADLFTLAIEKDVVSSEALEEGFLPLAEILDDVAIDAPKAFDLMAVMMKGAQLDKDSEQLDRIASKSAENKDKLISMLS